MMMQTTNLGVKMQASVLVENPDLTVALFSVGFLGYGKELIHARSPTREFIGVWPLV